MVARRLPDLAALDIVVTVARLGSMGAAARDLGISQQAVSARVRGAERELGVEIFIRSAGGVDITANGMAVLEWANALVERGAQFMTGVDTLIDARHATLVVAASKTVAEYLVPRWITTLTHQSDVKISVRPMNSADVIETVHQDEADLGFIESPGSIGDLTDTLVARDELVVVVAPGHRWSDGRTVDIAELAATPLIQREPGSGTRVTYEAALQDSGVSPTEPLIELRSVTAIRSSVLTSSGAAVLSRLSVDDDIEAGRLVRVEVAGLRMVRPLRAVWSSHIRLRGPARELLDIARAHGRPA
ncbi:LysR family transcriptional regulator [Gordonia sp. Z-3]|uniref:LysR family transcriptional regulator n=1 Tax=Gordonia tangerina TaxID=2911060 RepID=A0ABS9DF04_9ACTN|nr:MULTISPECIES: LysR family transcriptional regulator [Gordonia]MCF3937207.1 LysR family transcriptional regulator [Gordonia tangerina]MED5803004.1 LysR family transcriptional regulator [Gordonia sp. Z-3]